MTDRMDQKLRHVAVAQYRFRHEAEFAAGFLDDAAIPYRLQVDDAAMGMTIGTPATLWVRGMDVRRAREVLGIREGVDEIRDPTRESRARPDAGSQPATRSQAAPVISVVGARLNGRERALSAILCVASVGSGMFLPTGDSRPVWVGAIVAFAAATGLSALIGRTVGPIKAVLRMLSGDVR